MGSPHRLEASEAPRHLAGTRVQIGESAIDLRSAPWHGGLRIALVLAGFFVFMLASMLDGATGPRPKRSPTC